MTYRCIELHSHTLHSDGRFSPGELCRAAKEECYDGIALTDHNTISGLEEMDEALIAETLPVIPGIEWTTFYGHLVVLGADRFVDWRFARPETIDASLREIREAGGTVGIAHPFEFGSPFCTGCHWDFKVQNWDLVDYIEVWSEPFPLSSPRGRVKNPLAFEWWTELLQEGHRIAAASGRDWHGPDEKPVLPGVTYLGLEGPAITAPGVKAALRAGRTFVTLGPVLDAALSWEGGACGLGGTAPPGLCTLSLSLGSDRRKPRWEPFGLSPRELRLVHNGRTLGAIPCGGEYRGTRRLDLEPGWLRVELYGAWGDRRETLLAFTSPMYIEVQ